MNFTINEVEFRTAKGLDNDRECFFVEVHVKNTSGGCAARMCDTKGPHWCCIWEKTFSPKAGLGRMKAWLKKNWDSLEPAKAPNTL